jgi:hypothetical protein
MRVVLGASTSNGVDSVITGLVPAGQAGYTVDIVNRSLAPTAIEAPYIGRAAISGTLAFTSPNRP